VRLRPVATFVTVTTVPASARPATAPVTFCADTGATTHEKHTAIAAHNALLCNALLFIAPSGDDVFGQKSNVQRAAFGSGSTCHAKS
jgi:hypothetical protein